MKPLGVLPALLWLTGLLASPAAGQTISPSKVLDRYQQIVWRDQDGLPANGIGAIAQTPDGYLWLACTNKAARSNPVKVDI